MPAVLVPLLVAALVALAILAAWCYLPPEQFWEPVRRAGDALTAQYRAERTARELLKAALRPDEYRSVEERGFLDVPSPSRPNRVYRIPYGPGRVIVFDDGRFTMSLCLQPTTWLPCGDIILMHKLHIEANEETYLNTANRLRFP